MSKVSFLQTNFTAGEVSPRLAARVDVSKYNNGCKVLENMVVFTHGGAARRMGTRFVYEIKDSSKKGRLLPFKYSTTQAYIIEAGNLFFRFYKDEGVIISGTPVEVVTPYLEADLPGLSIAQAADVVYFFHRSYPVYKLSRTSHTSWTFAAVDFKDGPYLDTNATAITITPSVTTGNGTLLASAPLFAATDVGRLVRIKHAGNWGYVKITFFTSNVSVNMTVVNVLTATTATTTWALGAWSGTTGYPSCGTFYEDRLWGAGTTLQPQTIFASKSGDYENMAPTELSGSVIDDSGLVYTISTDDVNVARWFNPNRVLSLFTSGGEFSISAASATAAITPTNIRVSRETNRGCAEGITPVRVDGAILYWSRSKRKLFEYIYSFSEDAFKSGEASIFSEHISRTGAVAMAIAPEPDQILWTARADGQLIGFTYDRSQEVSGWHRHILGGTDAVVESVAVIPSTDGTFDQLWMIVKRTINGAIKRYVETLQPDPDKDLVYDKSKMWYLDSALNYSGAPITTVSGLNHLIGETVDILADGAVVAPKTVNGSGQITLDTAASSLIIGLPYTSKMSPVNIEQGGDFGTAQTKRGRLLKLGLRFYKTIGAKFGRDEDHLEVIPFRTASTPMGSSPDLFTGDKVVVFEGTWDRERNVTVVQDQPYPMTILGLVHEFLINE
jgi:hypothetical protein